MVVGGVRVCCSGREEEIGLVGVVGGCGIMVCVMDVMVSSVFVEGYC